MPSLLIANSHLAVKFKGEPKILGEGVYEHSKRSHTTPPPPHF